ncbi:AcrR family transcriptional regulator [Streptomyces sp. SAI-135]|uniref:TetR/AcrR family transcriptional regulator n=1 Tax=unclassified Streptomyces TaxID=2593676 RepID=UPI002476CD84|nr:MULTISPECIES: TetR family transcriptional regulator [unclassified Streptomyces]MDH6514335.1 AcrR family transcriptional regulator [Streptomyces sp. SAI-090]MDH6621581.1 AcrR family transcriptional regulator [Streptomyces sp. SAI-135]
MTDERPTQFQRARSAEQREIRKQAILDAATQLLTELPVAEISLRELSRRVGLSKTNVVRYFETREAVFFELLNRSLAQWIEELPAELPPAGPGGTDWPESEAVAETDVEAVTDALARSLARRSLLCDLLSALGTELERNISAESVREFKLVNVRLLGALAELLRGRITTLSPAAARELVSLTVVYTAGLWPFAHPSAAVSEAQRDPELAATKVDFAARLGRILHVTVTGLRALG